MAFYKAFTAGELGDAAAPNPAPVFY